MRPSASLILLLVIIHQCILARTPLPEELSVPDISNALEQRDTDPGPYSLTPEGVTDSDFLMPIEAAFTVTGRGTVVIGRIERGSIHPSDEIEIVGFKDTIKVTCMGVEMYGKLLDEGRTGENVGVLLSGIKREDIERGQVLAKPGSIEAHAKFEAQVHILSEEDGGRSTPFFNDYRPQFFFRTSEITGTIELPEGVEMVDPGDDVSLEVTLLYPVAMDVGLSFDIHEGGKPVGTGVVSNIDTPS